MKYRLIVKTPRVFRNANRLVVVGLWIIGGAGLALFIFGLSFYLAMRVEMRSTEVRIPDLAGLTLQAASDQVAPLELVLHVVEQRHDPAIPSGRVLQQMPPANAAVRRGRKVKLILSLGGRVLEVPDLLGQASRAVEIELRQEGFIPGDEARIPATGAAPGRVSCCCPWAGCKTPPAPDRKME